MIRIFLKNHISPYLYAVLSVFMPHWLCHCHSHRAQRLPGLCLALTLSEFLSHSLLPRTCYWHHPEAMACYDHPRDHYVSPERLGCFFSVSRSLFRRLVSFLTFDNKISQARLAVFPKHKPLSDLETQMEESPPEMLARDLTLPRSDGRERESAASPVNTGGQGAAPPLARNGTSFEKARE